MYVSKSNLELVKTPLTMFFFNNLYHTSKQIYYFRNY